jgi:hypothetical protein
LPATDGEGTEFNKQRQHGKEYFHELLGKLEQTPPSVISAAEVELGSSGTVRKGGADSLRSLREDRERVERLTSMDGIGEITALTCVLDTGEVELYHSIRQAVSYCRLTSARRSSADKEQPASTNWSSSSCCFAFQSLAVWHQTQQPPRLSVA